MNDTVALVDVSFPNPVHRGSQFPLPFRRFGDLTLLEWVVRRVSESQQLSRVLVVAGESDGATAESLLPPNVELFVSRSIDPLARFADAVEHAGSTSAVYVRVDCPFVDPTLIDHLVTTGHTYADCDYVTYIGASGEMTLLNRLGLFAEFCRSEAVTRADRMATSTDDRNSATRFIYSHPEHFQLRLSPVPRALDHEEYRLAILEEGDWDNAQMIYDALGREQLHWSRIADLLQEHPQLRQHMSALNESSDGQ